MDDLGLREHNIKVYYSGTGYHVMIHGDCFGFPIAHKDLPYVVKSTMENLSKKIGYWDMIDDHVYSRTAILRCPFSINPKSGLYKTPISIKELMESTVNDIQALAQTPRIDFEWEDEYSGEGELKQFLNLNVPPIPVYSRVNEPKNNYSCIYKILEEGPVKGTRNNAVLVLASHLMRSGMPSELAKKTLLAWNNKSLDERIVIEKVEQVYEKKYKYSCKSRLMKARCSTRCIHYTKQTANPATAQSFDDIIENAKRRDFLKELAEGIAIGKQIGFKPEEFVVTRGEIVTLLAATKAGKSTMMKNLVLGIDMTDPRKLMPEATLRKTLYYTAEQASEHFLVTCCQILENCSKEQALINKDHLLDKWRNRLSHIMPIDILPDMAGLREHIQIYDPEVIVIDTIDHFVNADTGNEHLGIKNAMLALQRITAETGIIICLVSQIKRDDSLNNKVVLFSGKGSGSIENQSRKVFGLISKDKNLKEVFLLADTYGIVPDDPVMLYLSKSLRFKKVLV